ncbi:FKBP-type peptidyl-prolyl cis-trans isomerase [Musa troglodytarum]|uniref:peptidylprolyl isomerase n=1 Tax=Musa troglodytarum TaxID=320322 RepID=A0A9E7JH13_9LILI|nr:FKBP-type peptidyl-prolyl cis-trans isomerase [Musa troglodytarum]
MAENDLPDQDFAPTKKKKSDDESEKRKSLPLFLALPLKPSSSFPVCFMEKKITPGSLMKAIIRSGEGQEKPVEGDQVIFHCTTRTLDGIVVDSTRLEHGGKGNPIRNVLGKSKMILGFLEGIPTMTKGEVAMFKMKPEIHYAEEDCPVTVSDDFPKNDELHFEIEMLDFHKVKVVGEDLGVVKKLPKGLEMGIGTMARGEKAAIFLNKTYMTKSSLMPMIEDHEEIQFEVELVHFIQLVEVHYKGMLLNEEKTVFYDTIVDNYGQPLEFRSGEGLVPEGLEMCVRLMLPGEISLVTCPPDYAYDKFTRPAIVPEGAHVQWEIELLDFEMPKGNRLFKEGKYELAKYEKNSLHLNVAACYQKMGEFRKSIETCNKMISIDKASEPDAAAALLKLKQKEQEADKKAKRQFKGLFDRNPGEIAEVGGDARDDKSPHKAEHEIENSGSEKEISKTDLDGGVTDNDDDDDGEHEPERIGFLGRLWPSGRRILAALGLNRCSIL